MKKIQQAPDEELVAFSIKNPDNFAFLVDRYWDGLFRFVRRISYFQKEDTEDILQETFIKIYRNLNSFDRSLKFSTWAYQIARNATIDAIRKKNNRVQAVDLSEDEIEKIFRADDDLENKIFKKEEAKKVGEIIAELPSKYREVLVLKFLEDKSYEEMVDILKKPKGTIASLVGRGKKILKEKYHQEHQFQKGLI